MTTTTTTPLGTLLMRATGWLMDHPDADVIRIHADDHHGVILHLGGGAWDLITGWQFDRTEPASTWGENQWTSPARDWYSADEDGIHFIISR